MLKRIVLWIIALGLPLNLIINYLYSQPLYQLGVQLILKMQAYSCLPLDYFFIFFTILIDPLFVMSSCVLLMLFMKQRITAYSTVIFILFNTYFLTVTKAFYAAPRPYWTHENVRNIGYYCPKDYGSPSGHAEFAAVVACVFLLQFIDTKRQKIYGFLAGFLMVMVSLSRMYLGGHSLDQVINGLLSGISLSILYSHGGLKQFINRLMVKTQRNYTLLLIGIIVIMHIFYVLGYVINHQKMVQHKDAAKIWLKNYKNKCGKEIDENYLNFIMVMLSSVIVNSLTGLIFGFKKMLNHQNILNFLEGQWKVNTQRFNWKPLSHIAFLAVEVSLFLSGFLFLAPMLIILEKSNLSTFIYANCACISSTYLYSSQSLRILQTLDLITFNSRISKQKPQ